MSADSTNDHLISIHALREEGDVYIAQGTAAKL